MNKVNIFRSSNYGEVLQRNVKRPTVISNIKIKLRDAFAILASGFGYSNAADFCTITKKPLISQSSFYDYQKKMEPILRKLAENICAEKVRIALQNNELVVAFDAGWAHRRNAHQCIGALLDVLTGYVLAFHIVHHSNEENATLSHTDKSSNIMEKIALEAILKQNDISKVPSVTVVHDCDIGANNIIQDLWPTANVLYDPNHFTRSQSRKIDRICSENIELNSIKERITKFYSCLMHDRTLDLDKKVSNWKNALNHYIETEGWTQENNGKTIEALKNLIEEFSKTFSEVNSNFSTNICESFNKARCLLANKDTAWRISWRLRAYISIIRWNDDNWIQTILNEFEIYDNDQTCSQISRQKRNLTKSNRKTEISRKNRSIKRLETKNKYKLKPNEKNANKYKDDTDETKPKVLRLSRNQKILLKFIMILTTEDKKYVSKQKLFKRIIETEENATPGYFKQIFASQLTRMLHDDIVIRKKNSYALSISREDAIELINDRYETK